MILLILINNYVFGIVGIFLFGANDRQHWGSLAKAMMSVWQVETLDGWDNIMYVNMYGCDMYGYTDLQGAETTGQPCTDPQGLGWAAAVFFVLLVVFGALVLPTVLIGVISVSFEESNAAMVQVFRVQAATRDVTAFVNRWAAESQSANVQKALRAKHGVWINTHTLLTQQRVFRELDADDSGYLDLGEIMPVIEHWCERYITSSHVTQKDCLKVRFPWPRRRPRFSRRSPSRFFLATKRCSI